MALQTKFKNIADNCCLAVSYLYAALDMIADTEEKNETFLETTIASVLVAGLIDDRTVLDKDGFVRDAEALMNKATGYKYRVEKKRIESIKDLPEKGYAVVNFERIDENGKPHNHWVLYKDRLFLYNSLTDSLCFKYGKPIDARIITLLGE